MRRIDVSFALVSIASALLSATAHAAGPTEIAACMTIAEPGSYVLVNNLTPNAPGDCLIVAADFVTIDLNGFLIKGVVVKREKAGIGVRTDGPRRGVALRGGTIADFEQGVLLDANADVQHIRALYNGRVGITAGPFAIVEDCIASGNGAPGATTPMFSNGGIRVGKGSRVANSTANQNGHFGIWTESGSAVSGSTANENGVFGILTAASTVDGNTANGNSSGLRVSCPAAIVGNTATGNSHLNIELVPGSASCVTAHNAP